MNHRSFRTVIFVLFIFGLFFTGCTNMAETEISQSTKLPTVAPEEPLLPTSTTTAIVTETVLPTATITSEPSLTPTAVPTEFLGFNAAKVYTALAYDTETLFYFIVPGVSAPYYGVVDGVSLDCEVDTEEVNLLVCRAEEDLFGTDVKSFEFYADEARSYLVYEGDFSTELDRLKPTPTPSGFIWPRADFTMDDVTWGRTPDNCPVRGINLWCETEYRRYEDGACLVGATCTDSCGFYYSVNTIKDRTTNWVGSGPCW